MSSWLLFQFFASTFIGAHVLYVIDGVPISNDLFCVLYLFPLVMIVASLLVENKKSRHRPDIQPKKLSAHSDRLSIYFCLFISLLLLLYYLEKIPRIPLLLAFISPDEVGDARADAMIWNASPALKYIFLIFVRYMVPFMAIYVYVCHRRNVKIFSSKMITRILIVFVYLILLLDGQKGQIIYFTVQLFVANRLTVAGDRVKKIKLTNAFFTIIGLLASFEVLIIIYYFFMESAQAAGSSLWEAHGPVAEAILRRVTISQAVPLLEIFNSFPSNHPYLFGKTFPFFSELFGSGPRFDLSDYSYRQIYGDSAIVGAASSLFVSEFYANFGSIGAISSVFLVLPVIVVIDKILFGKIRSCDGAAVYSFLVGYVMRLAITQVVMGLALPIVSVMFFYCIKKMFNIALLSRASVGQEEDFFTQVADGMAESAKKKERVRLLNSDSRPTGRFIGE